MWGQVGAMDIDPRGTPKVGVEVVVEATPAVAV